MKKLAFMFAAAMFVVCCMVGCKQATPATIAADCVEMIKAGDYEGYAATFNVNDEEKAQLAEMFEKKGKTTLEQMGGIEGYEVVEEVIDETGEKATVKVSITYGNGKIEPPIRLGIGDPRPDTYWTLNWQPQTLILGGSQTAPLELDWIRVWQRPLKDMRE